MTKSDTMAKGINTISKEETQIYLCIFNLIVIKKQVKYNKMSFFLPQIVEDGTITHTHTHTKTKKAKNPFLYLEWWRKWRNGHPFT